MIVLHKFFRNPNTKVANGTKAWNAGRTVTGPGPTNISSSATWTGAATRTSSATWTRGDHPTTDNDDDKDYWLKPGKDINTEGTGYAAIISCRQEA